MPEDEGLALHRAARRAAAEHPGLPLLEVGSYCGRSTLLLAAAARTSGALAVTVDHHRGSEEQQPGWEYHDPALVDPVVGRMDTLPSFRRTLFLAGLEDQVLALVGRSPQAAALWRAPLALVFIDGGHTEEHASADFAGWVPHLVTGGLLLIHDVFESPDEGGQAPFRVHQRALGGGEFESEFECGSLRVLRRTAGGPSD
jgi:predicted O-methyltransferase YrrM